MLKSQAIKPFWFQLHLRGILTHTLNEKETRRNKGQMAELNGENSVTEVLQKIFFKTFFSVCLYFSRLRF